MLDKLLATYGIYNPRFPEIAGSYSGKGLVICGDGACLWDDLRRFGCRDDSECGRVFKPGWDFMVVNAAGCKFPGAIEHWYSNDGNLVDLFASTRRQEYPPSFSVKHRHGLAAFQSSGNRWPWPGRGTSGCGALLTGLALGYEQIVGCGIPLNNSPHNGEPPWRKTNFVNEVRDDVKHWLRIAEHCGEHIRWMSGQPRQWFGNPSDCDCSSESACGMLDGRCQNTHLAVR